MKTWLFDTLLALVIVPLVWKLLPGFLRKYKEKINEIIKNALRATKNLWKGHATELEAVVDEGAKELKEDIEEVDKEILK